MRDNIPEGSRRMIRGAEIAISQLTLLGSETYVEKQMLARSFPGTETNDIEESEILYHLAIQPSRDTSTYLVEVLQQVDYPALNLVLGQTSRGRVETDALRDHARGHLDSNGRAADLDGSRGLDSGTGGGGPQGANNGGAEHGDGWRI